MAIDNSIYQNIGRGVKSINDYDNEAMQGQTNRLALLTAQNSIQDTQRGRDGDNALAQLIAGGKSGVDVATGLAQQGFGKQSMAYTKQVQDMAKDKAVTEKSQIENTMSKLSLGAQLLGGVKDQSSYDQARATAQANGLDVSRMQPNYDPAFVASKLQEGQTIKQQLEEKWKAMAYSTPDANAMLSAQTSTSNNAATNANSAANNAATVGMQRDRLTFDQTSPKGQVVQSDNGPVLVDPRTGTGRTVTGPDGQPLAGMTKPLNEGQSKALLFGSRMRDADKILQTLAGEGTQMSVPGSGAPLVGGIINSLSTDNRQMLNQAKTDFMTAVLRRESGAAISSGEFVTADKQYFPQVGDGPGVIAQKANNRQLAINGILIEVPEKQRGTLQSGGAPASVVNTGGASGSWANPPGKPADVSGLEAEMRRRGLLK